MKIHYLHGNRIDPRNGTVYMDFFDKHKALIITSLIFAVLLLSLYNLNLSNRNREAAEMLVDLEQFKTMEEQEPEKAPETEKQPQNTRKIQTNRAFNENKAEREADMDNRLNEIFEKNSAQQEELENESTSASEGNYSVRKKNATKKQTASEGADQTKNLGQKSAAYDYSSISFSLKGRNAVKIPNPVYTCDQAGKIVVNITVNEAGAVTDAAINKGSSSSNNECLTERALQYALGARFTRLNGQNGQIGTITYYFKS
ncbi:energy transducer TonB family protein [Christiangramia flava]|uniref:energy transducer TonB family protein n=1 Tax=Christiangramia flava TaxID=1486245 RepID=UPI001F4D447B|nr:hypothetical protein [Christiangramia flava]